MHTRKHLLILVSAALFTFFMAQGAYAQAIPGRTGLGGQIGNPSGASAVRSAIRAA